jgi:hypothetical protein
MKFRRREPADVAVFDCRHLFGFRRLVQWNREEHGTTAPQDPIAFPETLQAVRYVLKYLV